MLCSNRQLIHRVTQELLSPYIQSVGVQFLDSKEYSFSEKEVGSRENYQSLSSSYQ